MCAAYGIYLGTAESDAQDAEDLYEDFGEKKNYLLSARPTAVSLSRALERWMKRLGKIWIKALPR